MGSHEGETEAAIFKWSKEVLIGRGLCLRSPSPAISSLFCLEFAPLIFHLDLGFFCWLLHLDPDIRLNLPLAVDMAEFCLGLAKRRQMVPILLGEKADYVCKARTGKQQLAEINSSQSKEQPRSHEGVERLNR